MQRELIEQYERLLGLKPVSLSALLAGPIQGRPYRVATVDRGWCRLLGLDDAGELQECSARPGREPLAVGDWVLLEQSEANETRVALVAERRSWLQRGSAHREGQRQLIAANLDRVFIVTAFAETDKLQGRALRARRLDRFKAAVIEGGAEAVVVVNKLDLSRRSPAQVQELCDSLCTRLGGTPVVPVSALQGRGLEPLREGLVPGDTVAFIGPSGVGKSSLINALIGQERQREGAVRSADSKGRHTTTRRELLALPSGTLLIDTPGVREFAVVSDDAVAGFDDVAQVAQQCRFGDCTHESEPGCAVRQAVARGELDGERVRSQRDLERDAQRLRSKQGGLARQQEHAEERRFGRLVRRAMHEKKSR